MTRTAVLLQSWCSLFSVSPWHLTTLIRHHFVENLTKLQVPYNYRYELVQKKKNCFDELRNSKLSSKGLWYVNRIWRIKVRAKVIKNCVGVHGVRSEERHKSKRYSHEEQTFCQKENFLKLKVTNSSCGVTIWAGTWRHIKNCRRKQRKPSNHHQSRAHNQMPFARTNSYQKSFFCYVPNVWNNLPSVVVESSSADYFKENILLYLNTV